jgi:hypothetical protein
MSFAQRCVAAGIAALVCTSGPCQAGWYRGVVLKVTDDEITISGDYGEATFGVSPELLTNTPPPGRPQGFFARFTDVRKGQKIGVGFYLDNGRWICGPITIYQTPAGDEKERSEKEK